MTLFAFLTKTDAAAGARATLLQGDTLFVDEGISVARTDGTIASSDAVIVALAGSNSFDIRGKVLGNVAGIRSGDDAAVDGGSDIRIASTGLVKSFDSAAIVMAGKSSTVTNQGSIEGMTFGLLMSGISSATESKIVNTGTIVGEGAYGIFHSGYSTEALTVHNTGTIRGGFGSFNGGSVVETIINAGTMVGDAFLAGGADRYDGRQGTVQGTVYGGQGTDTLLGGAGNDVFKGETEADMLDGGAGNDTLSGDGGADTIKGGAGNDTLDGGTEADRLEGGAGNDTYVIDDAGDVVVELVNGGTDTVKVSISHTLAAHVERLTLTGSDNIDGTGNGLANILTGNAGKNTLSGLAGNDTLKGLDGNDTLDGGAGIDRMEGGIGNDTYVVDNAKDVVAELAGQGTDTIKASVSLTLGAEVERLTLTGSGNLNGTGNALANTLIGNTGANTLKGLAGNDTLDGGKGADRLEGETGNDTYVVDNAKDVVVELAGQGTDTVKSSVSHTLSANVERLTLTGTGAINGTGNTLSNILTGNTGNNILKGEGGNDTLIGGKGADQLYSGAGKDMFVFKAAEDSTAASAGRDKIFDFTVGSDKFDLRGVDADSSMMDDQAFTFIGSTGFHKTAGELRFEVKSGDTIVHGDINGDGAADFSFVLDTVVDLKSSDFLL